MILRPILAKESSRIIRGQAYHHYCVSLRASTLQIYRLGLDAHVAFLGVEHQHFWVIYLSGSQPWCMEDEAPDEALVLEKSNCGEALAVTRPGRLLWNVTNYSSS